MVKVTTASVAERDQECGKSKLNGTALATWAFNARFSSTAGVPEQHLHDPDARSALEQMGGKGMAETG